MFTVEDYRQYCIANNYFTCGTSKQYNQAFLLVKMLERARYDKDYLISQLLLELATVTWICSDPDNGMTIVDYLFDIRRLFYR